jgi:hypothetical protein
MNISILDQAEHLQNEIVVLDAAMDYWRLNRKLWGHCLALTVKLITFWHEIGLIRKELEVLSSMGELDEHGVLADKLLTMQQNINARYVGLTDIDWVSLTLSQRLALWPLYKLHLALHKRIGLLRMFILESDADFCGLSDAGSFTNAQSLADYLHKL